ncbi:DNA adenine methylase [Vibrio nigripulchritudo SO65]|uniref:Site-specific DNA-methyltransferase (adenine-specific) n=1 Tax=Vibrio nigripulchritudo SOn1 TaxID=1238450 RepID=A0AAV2VIQ2_9VIBR|nr:MULTISPECIES: Dam family site-specific DNA-(adenine-N6)-methyltransferase [Vibrio]UAB70606.1 Dam family site-specific DNA-(adenine-N6)-methyltransferase [Vibrio sp. SCSIO 43132]CCN32760.1 DNA adenine methylase [Vibrio nigripulchritudo AM115]CCN41036.1 DNA adenine methylase [Vibrio nigripulchritudo FTn2]CCN65153.1 DNA adenine methylase [Vibrio nigripulchritudo POn4]CCN75947.1 DNA adenine methylase [Vibrio nigripulchritudo SO65]
MKKQRAFLKWAGGKYGLVEDIQRHLPPARKLVEPFVGAGSVFLNTDYEQYLLADINPDLINLYNLLKEHPEKYIEEAKRLFTIENNRPEAYYSFREEFNQSSDKFRRSVIFLYMNRFGYNGLCRYNKKGGFNVPFGRYKRPYFPEEELEFFANKAKRATFEVLDFEETINRATSDSVVYCDPPYAPLSVTASFTSYAGNGFGINEQVSLAKCAEDAAFTRNIPVLISNHDTKLTQKWYEKASTKTKIEVNRFISSKGTNRRKVNEILALYRNET